MPKLSGTAMIRAMIEVVIVPYSGVRAPYTSVTGFQRSPVTKDHLKVFSAGQLPEIRVRMTPARTARTSSAENIVAVRNTASARASRCSLAGSTYAGVLTESPFLKRRGSRGAGPPAAV